MKLFEQIENEMTHHLKASRKPWSQNRGSKKWVKTEQHRANRRDARRDPECQDTYRKYRGWEW